MEEIIVNVPKQIVRSIKLNKEHKDTIYLCSNKLCYLVINIVDLQFKEVADSFFISNQEFINEMKRILQEDYGKCTGMPYERYVEIRNTLEIVVDIDVFNDTMKEIVELYDNQEKRFTCKEEVKHLKIYSLYDRYKIKFAKYNINFDYAFVKEYSIEYSQKDQSHLFFATKKADKKKLIDFLFHLGLEKTAKRENKWSLSGNFTCSIPFHIMDYEQKKLWNIVMLEAAEQLFGKQQLVDYIIYLEKPKVLIWNSKAENTFTGYAHVFQKQVEVCLNMKDKLLN